MVSNGRHGNHSKCRRLHRPAPRIGPNVDITSAQEGASGAQGGGALGACTRLARARACSRSTKASPDWVAGVSIGAINAADRGHVPDRRGRVQRLRGVLGSASPRAPRLKAPVAGVAVGDRADVQPVERDMTAAVFGAPGCCRRRIDPALAARRRGAAAELLRHRAAGARRVRWWTSIASTAGDIRFQRGRGQRATGNSIYFDNTDQRIGPEHIMASGALPRFASRCRWSHRSAPTTTGMAASSPTRRCSMCWTPTRAPSP